MATPTQNWWSQMLPYLNDSLHDFFSFKARSICSKVSLSIIDISSIIKTFNNWYLFNNIRTVSSLSFLYQYDLNPD